MSPEEYFMAEKCPKFQAQHMTVPDIQPQNIHLPDVVEKTVTEVTSNVTTTMETPELYANPALGCAQASSTPDPSRGQGVCACVCVRACVCVVMGTLRPREAAHPAVLSMGTWH